MSAPVRITLLSPGPVPSTAVVAGADLLAGPAGRQDLTGPGDPAAWQAVQLTGSPAARVTGPAQLRAELRGAVAGLGVDTAVVDGPLATRPPGLVVMDVDSTLITAEVIELLAEHAGTARQVADVTERAMRGELDFAASLRDRVATLAGLPHEVLDQVRRAVRLSPGAEELVAAVHAAGGRVGLVSGGFIEVVGPLAAALGVDHVHANALEVTEGRLTGRTRGPVVDRAVKARMLAQWATDDGVPLARTMAVGDGANDLDMLAAAGLGVAFCAKPVVRQAADAAVTFPRLDAAGAFVGLAPAG